jgi:hypothetical protein
MLHTLTRIPPSDAFYGFDLFLWIVGGSLAVAALISAGLLLKERFIEKERLGYAFRFLSPTFGIIFAIALIIGVFGGMAVGGNKASAHDNAVRDIYAKKFAAEVRDTYGITLTRDAVITLNYTGGRVDAVVDGHIVELALVPTGNAGYVLTADGQLLRKAH